MNCGCDGEIWVSATCQQGFECRGAYDLGNPGNLVTCPAGQLFYVDLATKVQSNTDEKLGLGCVFLYPRSRNLEFTFCVGDV